MQTFVRVGTGLVMETAELRKTSQIWRQGLDFMRCFSFRRIHRVDVKE